MTHISRTAKFDPSDTLPGILEDLACPVCGHHDPGDAHNWITDNRVRIFCDCCGSFITTVMSDEQARAVHRWSKTLPTISDRRSQTRT